MGSVFVLVLGLSNALSIWICDFGWEICYPILLFRLREKRILRFAQDDKAWGGDRPGLKPGPIQGFVSSCA